MDSTGDPYESFVFEILEALAKGHLRNNHVMRINLIFWLIRLICCCDRGSSVVCSGFNRGCRFFLLIQLYIHNDHVGINI